MEGDTTGLSIAVQIANTASSQSGNDILPVTSPDVNYAFTVRITSADVASGGSDSLDLVPSTAVILNDTLASAALAAGLALTVDLQVDVDLPYGSCSDAAYLCVNVTADAGASFVDADSSDNVICEDISSMRQCTPGEMIPQHADRRHSFLNLAD